jgi:hypothetical protein
LGASSEWNAWELTEEVPEAVELLQCPACLSEVLDSRRTRCPACRTPVARATRRPLPLLERELEARIEAKTAPRRRQRRRAAKVARRIAALPPTIFGHDAVEHVDDEPAATPPGSPTIIDLPAEAVLTVRSTSVLAEVAAAATAPVVEVVEVVEAGAPKGRGRGRPVATTRCSASDPTADRGQVVEPVPPVEAAAPVERPPKVKARAPVERPVKAETRAPVERTVKAEKRASAAEPARAEIRPGVEHRPKVEKRAKVPAPPEGKRPPKVRKPVEVDEPVRSEEGAPVEELASAERRAEPAPKLASVTRIGTQGTNPVWRDRVFNSPRRTQETVTWPRPRTPAANRAAEPFDRYGGAAG